MGTPLHEIREWPAADVERLRRFYARHPFGPLRGDLQAWLAGTQARTAKPLTLDGAMNALDFPPRKKGRRRRKRRSTEPMTSDTLKAVCIAFGGTVAETELDGTK